MANSIASLVKIGTFRTAGSFDTFSSYGVSLNSPLSSTAIGIGKQLLSKIASDTLFNTSITNIDGKQRVGMVNGDGTQLDAKYRVSIISTKLNKVITGYLQDRTQLKVASKWEPFVTFGKDTVSNALEKLAQAGGKSLQNVALSRRMWTGTSPIEMTLNLTFEAITNSMSEVMEPCKALLKIASPSRYGTFNGKGFISGLSNFKENDITGSLTAWGNAIKGGDISLREDADGFFLAPPGPYPFIADNDYGDTISIHIGEFLMFTPVIVSAVEVDFDTRIDSNGSPISAKAIVKFETYQVFGKQDIDTAFSSALNANTTLNYAKRFVANAAGFV